MCVAARVRPRHRRRSFKETFRGTNGGNLQEVRPHTCVISIGVCSAIHVFTRDACCCVHVCLVAVRMTALSVSRSKQANCTFPLTHRVWQKRQQQIADAYSLIRNEASVMKKVHLHTDTVKGPVLRILCRYRCYLGGASVLYLNVVPYPRYSKTNNIYCLCLSSICALCSNATARHQPVAMMTRTTLRLILLRPPQTSHLSPY